MAIIDLIYALRMRYPVHVFFSDQCFARTKQLL